MKTFNKIAWIIFIIGLIFKYLLHWPGYSVLLLLSCFLLLIHGTINFIQNIKNDKPKSLISLSFGLLTLSLFFRMNNWFFQEYVFLLAFLFTVTCIILHLIKKTKTNFHLIILLFYFSFIFILYFIYFWQKNGINDQSRRNENWIWFVDKLTGIGSWAIVGNKMELKDGRLTFFYSSGEIFCDGQIRESVYIDTARFYDKTGKCIKNIIYYRNGNNKIYYPLGGKYYDYYKTGEMQTEGYVVNHKLEGLKKLYSKNGKIFYQANMINDSGWSSDYYESGSMKDSFYLANGKQYGTYKEWYENGKLLEISNWNNSLQHGARVTYFENGVIKLKDFWTLGKRNGLFRDYYSNGNLQTSRIFKNGQEEGQTQSYYENGKLQIEFGYINGSKEGVYKQYHVNGKPNCIGQFENDKEIGEWLWYDEKGKLFQIDTYNEGQIIDNKKIQ